MRRAGVAWAVAVALVPPVGSAARAQAPDAGVAAPPSVTAPSSASAGDAVTAPSACVEHVPEGKSRPVMAETFPARAKAGYAATLRLSIPHGLGERVLPGGFKLLLDSPEGRELSRSGFQFADLQGPAAPRIERTEQPGTATTVVELSFVPLPEEPGPQTLVLPSLPIAIARASGDLTTLCTHPHSLAVEDPTSSIALAEPKPNPPPRPQREVWEAAKNVALGALIALPLGALCAFLIGMYRRRERPPVPPPPPRPAWDTALEALARLRRGELSVGRTREHYAAVAAAVREYLGQRYGFDGLESTTRETMRALSAVRPRIDALADVRAFLQRADLVKFANLVPEVAECERALDQGESIVRHTMDPERAELRAAARGEPLTHHLKEES